ncbi:MAG: hypothetical protein IKR71_06900 [Bacteroidales bacterium]|nr:hypothetical protein [Bacteroidales bacterium]
MENQSTKYGDVKKCPQCGAPVEPMAVKCSTCGYEFRNVEALKSSQVLAAKLDEIDAAYRDKEFNSRAEEKRDKDRASVIQNFPIPTTKEDLLDFTVSMRAKKLQGQIDVETEYNAYVAKYEECLMKLKMLFPDDPQAQLLIAQDKEDKEKLEEEERKSKSKEKKIFLVVIVIFAVLLILSYLLEL